MVVAPNGDVFVSVQGSGAVSAGVWILRDENGDGKADRQVHFASGFSSSEVALFDGNLYTGNDERDSSLPVPERRPSLPRAKPDTVAEDLPRRRPPGQDVRDRPRRAICT